MLNSGSINEKIDMTDNEITRETLDNILIKTINTIRCNKKGPDVNSISEYHNEKLHNSNITSTLINNRREITNSTSYCVKDNNVLEPCISNKLENNPKTPKSSPS